MPEPPHDRVSQWARWITFAGYSMALRRIAADISGVSRVQEVEVRRRREINGKMRNVTVKEMKRSNLAPDGRARATWLEKVDRIPLAKLTPNAVGEWRIAYVKEHAGDNPEKEKSAKRTANSLHRKAKALFSKEALKKLNEKFTLPDPVPFDEVRFFKVGAPRYKSKVDAMTIFRNAIDELAESDPEALKVFLLAIGAGLRREEIDTLLWSQFDAQKRKIDIRATKYFKPKSDQSENTVDLDDEVVAILQGYRAKAKVGTTYSYYRADPIFIRLLTWLKAQGLGGTNNRKDKPIHSLRKEFGSLLHKTYGIFAASRSLRHASIQVTESHYLDKKERTTAGLGRLAKDEQEESAV